MPKKPTAETGQFYSPDDAEARARAAAAAKPLPRKPTPSAPPPAPPAKSLTARERSNAGRKSAAKKLQQQNKHSAIPFLGGAEQVDKKKSDLTGDVDLALSGQEKLVWEPGSLEADIARIRQLARPFGSLTQKLAIPQIPGYYIHWFNDEPGRIDEQLERGWTGVQDRQGRPVKRIVGRGRTGAGLFAYALKIPLVFREEEMARRHAEARARIGEMKKNPFPLRDGESANPKDEGKFYSPGKSIVSVREPSRPPTA